MISFFIRLACATALVLAFAAAACAEGFALYEYSARGVALGGTLVARKPDASAIAYNPALIARLPGVNVMAGLSTISPAGKMRTEVGGVRETTELRAATWPIPHLYYTHQINGKFTFGVGEFTRYGLGFEYPHDWPGRFNVYQVSLLSASIAPNIAWAATDKLSLAVGPEIVYVDLDLKKRAELPLVDAEVDSNIRKATDTSIGWNASGHYQFNEQWAVGFLYRSQVRVHAKGDVEFSLMGDDANTPTAQMIYGGAGFEDGKAHATVILPDSYTAGLSFAPVPELSFELAATYTRWSSFRDLNIHLPGNLPANSSHKHWRDVWRLGFGVEYAALDWLTLRAGYTFDQSPMPEGSNEDYLIPSDDRHIWSLGVGFNWDDWTLDLAYAYIDVGSRGYTANPDTDVVNSQTGADNCTHIGSISVSYRF